MVRNEGKVCTNPVSTWATDHAASPLPSTALVLTRRSTSTRGSCAQPYARENAESNHPISVALRCISARTFVFATDSAVRSKKFTKPATNRRHNATAAPEPGAAGSELPVEATGVNLNGTPSVFPRDGKPSAERLHQPVLPSRWLPRALRGPSERKFGPFSS